MKPIKCDRHTRSLTTILFCCLLLLSSISAWGQSTTEGAIGGTVVDPQNKVVAGAAVSVRDNGSNQVFRATTGPDGYFRVGQLQPATYTVAVIAQGFAPYKAEQVIVTVGSLTPLIPHLTIGTTEQVDVTAEVALVNVTSNDFTQTLDSTGIENLPLNGGRWSSFAMLTPGVVSDPSGYGLISVRGISPLLNNVTVDGADNNQAFFSEERGRTRAGYSTAKVAVQEFQVNTSNYSSEYGRSAGAVINTVTKSGTNAIHGEVFWEDRNNTWGSRNPFTTLTTFNSATDTTTTSPYKPEDVRKMGGLGVGGPLIKDKLFWFVGYDRYHRNFPDTSVPNSAASYFAAPDTSLASPVACGGSGNNAPSTADANVCTLAGYINGVSTTKVTAAEYTAAADLWQYDMFGKNSLGAVNPTGGLISDTGYSLRKGDQDIFFPKLDWIINQKNHASFEVNRMRWWAPGGIYSTSTNADGISTLGNDYVKDTWGVVKLDTLLTNTMSNQVRFQYGRDFEFETEQSPSAYDHATLVSGSNPYGIPPTVALGGITIGSSVYGNRIAYPDEYKTQLADTVSMVRGRHNIKFGFDFVKSNDTTNQLYEQYGYYSYSGPTQYFADLANPALKEYSSFTQAFQGSSASTPAQSYQFSTKDFALFAQDDWKLARRLTVNLGLRYETEIMPNSISALNNPITLGTQTITLGQMPNNPNNWGPRVGFAWDIFGSGKTVLRGGYGMYFGRVINATIFSALTSTGSLTSASEPTYYMKYNSACAPTFPNILAAAPNCAASLTLNYFDPNFKMPQIHEVDLSLQHELPGHMVFSMSYLGSFGRHLQTFTDINLAAPGTPYCSAVSKGVATGAQATCGSTTQTIAPPSTISYTLSNQVSGNNVSGMPVPSTYASTVPFFTSRLNPAYGAVVENASSANSSYNALVIQLEKRMSNHVQFAMNYTWSHAMDDGVNETTNAPSYPAYVNPLNGKQYEYGNSNYNVPNRFTFYAVLQSPWSASGWKKYLVEGWEASPVVQIQNGLPYSVTTYSSYYPAAYVATSATTSQEYQSVAQGMLGAGGSYQMPGTGRNAWQQPATYVFDLRLAKQVTLDEHYKLEFTADGFNLFNHDNVTGISTTAAYTGATANTPGSSTSPVLSPYTSEITGAAGSQSSLFGVPSSGNSNFVYGTRQIQLGVRLLF
jgi:hypothetical protein